MYAIDGTIGSGKSSVLAELERRHEDYGIYQEPISQFTDFAGTNPLQAFYNDPAEKSFEFQLHAYLCANDQLFEVMDDTRAVRIIERGVPSCRYIFTELLHDQGNLSEFRYRLLQRVFNNVSAPDAPYRVSRVFLLITDADVALARIEARGRPEEGEVSREYVRLLQEYIVNFYDEDSPHNVSNVYSICTDSKTTGQIADEVTC